MTDRALTPKGTEKRPPKAVERRHAHWTEARSAVVFSPREPAWVPSGYWMSALQSWRLANEEKGQILIATFTGPNGAYFTVEQTAIQQPSQFEFKQSAPVDGGVSTGVVDIHGQPAQWRTGVPIGDPGSEATSWDTSLVSVAWTEGTVLYRLDAKGLDVSALMRVARSLG